MSWKEEPEWVDRFREALDRDSNVSSESESSAKESGIPDSDYANSKQSTPSSGNENSAKNETDHDSSAQSSEWEEDSEPSNQSPHLSPPGPHWWSDSDESDLDDPFAMLYGMTPNFAYEDPEVQSAEQKLAKATPIVGPELPPNHGKVKRKLGFPSESDCIAAKKLPDPTAPKVVDIRREINRLFREMPFLPEEAGISRISEFDTSLKPVVDSFKKCFATRNLEEITSHLKAAAAACLPAEEGSSAYQVMLWRTEIERAMIAHGLIKGADS